MVALVFTLASAGDWISLGDFATWLKASTVVAAATLDELEIDYVRIGSRGMYRISVTSVAEAFSVQLPTPTKDNDVPSETAIAKPQLIGNAVVNALTTEAMKHATG